MEKIDFDTFISKIKATGTKPVILMGAGSSITGNIPTASQIITDLKNDVVYSACMKKPESNDYFEIMGSFNPIDRRNIFKKYINNSNLNVSNFLAAQLLINNKVNCILTTNFDDLLSRGCSLFSNPLPIYDVTLSNTNISTSLYFPSIIYLHGQMHSFWQLNTKKELERHKKTIKIFLSETLRDTPIIIVGYSGNDHILDLLSEFDNFNAGLYWVSYKRNKPSKRVNKLVGNKIGSYLLDDDLDSDSFFYKYSSHYDIINIYNENFIKLSLLHISSINSIVKYDQKGIDILSLVKEKLAKALDFIDDNAVKVSKAKINQDEIIIDIKQVIEIFREFKIFIEKLVLKDNFSLDEEFIDIYDSIISFFRNSARNFNSVALFMLTIELCKTMLLKPNTDKHYFNYIIAICMSETGKISDDENILIEAEPFYEKAKSNTIDNNKIKGVLNCLGVSKHDIANILLKKGYEKNLIIPYLNESYNNFISAIQISSQDGKLLNNIASLLIDTSIVTNDKFLISQAMEKASEAEKLKSGSGSFNLGCCYSILGEKDKSLFWIEKAMNSRNHKREQFEQEENLINIKSDGRFEALLKRYFEK